MTLEALERRDCPAVLFDFVQGDEGGILTITGDEEDNYIAMQSVRGGINVVLGDGSVRVFENVAEIVVNSLGGADTVDAPKFWGFGTELPRLQIHAGAGNDRVTIGDGNSSSVSGRITGVVADPLDATIDLGTGADKLVFQVCNHDIVNLDVQSADSFDSVQVGVQYPLAHPIRLLDTRSATFDINLAGGGHTVVVQTHEVDVVDLNVVVYAGRSPSDPSGNTIYVSSSGGGVWRSAVNLEGGDNLVDVRTEDIDKVALDLLAAGDHNVVKHELGHTLGFRHEHTRPETAAQANLMFLGNGNEVEFKSDGYDQVDLDFDLTGNGNQAEIALLLPAVQKVREAAARVSLQIDGSNNQGTVSNQGYGKWELNLAKLVDSDDASAAATQGRSLFSLSTEPIQRGTVPTGSVTFIIDGNSQAGPVGDILTIQGQGFGAASVDVDTAGGNDSIWIDIGAPIMNVSVDTGAGDDNVQVNTDGRYRLTAIAAQISVSIDTGAGDDTAEVKANAGQIGDRIVDPRNRDTVNIDVDLGDGNDLANISSQGFAVDSLKLKAGDGNDTVSADSFYGTGVYKSTDCGKTWNVDLGRGDDHLDLNSAHYGVVNTAVIAGDGDDTVETRSNVNAVFLTVGFFEVKNDVKTGAGDDKVSIHNEGFSVVNTRVDTDEGNDTVEMLSSRAGVAVLKSTDRGASNLGTVTFTFTLGVGDDHAKINTIGYGEVNGVVDAGDGDDTLVSNSSPTPAGAVAGILYAAIHNNDIHLGRGNDRLTIETSGAVNTNTFVDAGDGDDTIISNSTPTAPPARPLPVLLVIANRDFFLGAGDDRLVINTSGESLSDIFIDGGAGNDQVKFKPIFAPLIVDLDNPTRLNLEALLGAGNDRLEADTAGAGQANILIDGGDGDDEVGIRHRMFAVVDRTKLNLVILLGAGDDTLAIDAAGYREVKVVINSGPEGDGSDSISANVQSLRRNGREQAGRVVLDGGLDVYEYRALGYLVQGTNPSPISVEWVFIAI